MTWLHLTVPALAAAALYAIHRGGVCFSCLGHALKDIPAGRAGRADRLRAFLYMLEGYGYAGLAVGLALAAGFVWGRIL